MKINSNKGFVGVDMVLAILAIIIFSAIIVPMMYNNFLENSKINRRALAIIYLTETLENVGIAAYDDVTQENINNFIPSDIGEYNYEMKVEVTNDDLVLSSEQQDDIIRKIKATISYKLGNKTYEHSMERIKAK